MTEEHDVDMQKLTIANIALRQQVENQRLMYEEKLTKMKKMRMSQS